MHLSHLRRIGILPGELVKEIVHVSKHGLIRPIPVDASGERLVALPNVNQSGSKFPSNAEGSRIATDSKSEHVPKVLCLHGSMQNGTIFQDRLKTLLKKARALAEFAFIDAPHIQSVDEGDGEKRCWWRPGLQPGEPHPEWAAQWEESRQTIEQALEEACKAGRPFDGIMGFSNGAAVAAMVLALAYKAKRAYCSSEAPDCYRSLRFGILCSGYLPHILKHEEHLEGVATLHVVGDSDPLITPQETQELFDHCSTPQPIKHVMVSVKHHVPSRSQDVSRICNFLKQQHAVHSDDFR